MERHADRRFVGFIGLQRIEEGFTFAPCIEIAGGSPATPGVKGYATEGAAAVRDLAFGALGLDAIVSIAATVNNPSRRVMERIGMSRDAGEDVDLPGLPEGHPLRPWRV